MNNSFLVNHYMALLTSGNSFMKLNSNSCNGSKDHIEKINFQELIFAVVNWPNSDFCGAIVCLYDTLVSLLQPN